MAQTPAQKAARKLADAQGPGNLYSHSALQAFRDCAFRWYGRYALGLNDGPSYALAYGHLVHAVGSRALQAQLAGAPLTDPAPLQPWIAAARLRYSPAGGAECDEQALVPAEADEAIARTALRIAASLQADAQAVHTEGVLLQALPVGRGPAPRLDAPRLEALLCRDNDPAAYFAVLAALREAGCNGLQVRPDATVLAPGSVTFSDWKTNRRRPGKRVADLVEQYGEQLRLYAAVGRRRWPGRKVSCLLHAFEFGDPAPVPATGELLDAAARAAASAVRSIAEAAAQGPAGFPKNVGEGCRYCHLAKLRVGDEPACPQGREYRKAKGWDRFDDQDALARIRAGIAWPGDEPYRGRLLAQGREIAQADAVAAGEAEAADPITAEVAGWTPEEAAACARQVQALEAGAAAAKDLRPYVQRYIELRGPIALAPDPDRGLPGGTWALAGGKAKTLWAHDVLAVEATLRAAGRDPAPYLLPRIDAAAVEQADARAAAGLAALLADALRAGGHDPDPWVRRILNVEALDAALREPEIFELLQPLRREQCSPVTLRFQKDGPRAGRGTGAGASAAGGAGASPLRLRRSLRRPTPGPRAARPRGSPAPDSPRGASTAPGAGMGPYRGRGRTLASRAAWPTATSPRGAAPDCRTRLRDGREEDPRCSTP